MALVFYVPVSLYPLSPDIKLMRPSPFWALSHTHTDTRTYPSILWAHTCSPRHKLATEEEQPSTPSPPTKCISRSPIKRRSLRAPNQNRSRSNQRSTARKIDTVPVGGAVASWEWGRHYTFIRQRALCRALSSPAQRADLSSLPAAAVVDVAVKPLAK